jgi:hypothetical protein
MMGGLGFGFGFGFGSGSGREDSWAHVIWWCWYVYNMNPVSVFVFKCGVETINHVHIPITPTT